MFCKATLVVIAVGLMAAAGAVAHDGGINIPLGKRATLTKADGTFDFESAIVHNVKTYNKYQAHLRMYIERNGALSEGAKLMDFKTVPEYLNKKRAKDTGSEPLTDQEQDIEWSGDIFIGTPAARFTIDFDTGSSDLWIPSSDCSGSPCSGKHKYDPSKSSTSKKQKGQFQIQYGDNSTVSGPIYTDTVTVAGITVENQLLSPVTSLSSSFSQNPIDGVLGLALPAISNLNGNPFFNSAIEQRKVAAGEFAFNLAKEGSTVYLGGTDSTKFSGHIEYHKIDDSLGLWLATGASVVLDGKPLVDNFKTIIDSGTTLMYGTPTDVKKFYADIPGSKLADEQQGFYSFPCDSVPKTGFSWGGKIWEVTADNFNQGPVEQGSSDCIGTLSALDLGLPSGVWLLGDSFMKNVYSVFSFDKRSVGFATLADRTD